MRNLIRRKKIFERHLGATGISNKIMADGTFTNGDLAAGVLTITHNKNSSLIDVIIRDPSGAHQLMSDVVATADTATVDFGGAIGASTWTWLVIAKK